MGKDKMVKDPGELFGGPSDEPLESFTHRDGVTETKTADGAFKDMSGGNAPVGVRATAEPFPHFSLKQAWFEIKDGDLSLDVASTAGLGGTGIMLSFTPDEGKDKGVTQRAVIDVRELTASWLRGLAEQGYHVPVGLVAALEKS